MREESKLVVLFDEYIRRYKRILDSDCHYEFLRFVKNQEECRVKWKESKDECVRLKARLDKANDEIQNYEKKLNKARMLLDEERRNAIQARRERDELHEQVDQIENILMSVRHAGNRLANETKEKLDKFLSMTHSKTRQTDDFDNRLNTIDEINSTGSLLSDNDYTHDTLDLDASLPGCGFRKPKRSSSPVHEMPVKKRKSDRIQDQMDKIEKESEPKKGFMTPSRSEIFSRRNFQPSAPSEGGTSSDGESDASGVVKCFSSPNLRLFSKPHSFAQKTLLKPSEECGVCSEKVSFGNKMFYCQDCKISCHVECQKKVPLPCVAVFKTPRGTSRVKISDYCGRIYPMIPSLVVHCVKEVESRGLDELGIYEISASERDVRLLKERILRGKNVCSLSAYNIHVICGTIKDFLRNLSEPLVTFRLRPKFIEASQENGLSSFDRVVSQLPQCNRDTLAFLLGHLQKVAESPDCKMSKANLARVFGPIIVGYSSVETSKIEISTERAQQINIMECFLEIPNEYWNKIISDEGKENERSTPLKSYSLRRRERNIFNTPRGK